MQVAAFWTSRETSSKPQNLQKCAEDGWKVWMIIFNILLATLMDILATTLMDIKWILKIVTETPSKPRNLQKVQRMDEHFGRQLWSTFRGQFGWTSLMKDKFIKTSYIGFIRKKERPGHEVASRNEFHVGVLVSLQGTIIEQNHVGQNPKSLRRKFCGKWSKETNVNLVFFLYFEK